MSLRAAILLAVGALLALPGYAQDTFYGHVGASYGRARLDSDCPGVVTECDRTQNAWKVFAGSRFNKWLGGEISYLRADNFKRGGGDTDIQLVNLGLLAGIPFGLNSSLFAKGGILWGHTEATGLALGGDAGSQNGWGPSFGVGAQMGVTKNWALRVDLDRYRPKFPGNTGRENLDTLMLGVQYSFGAG
ncbi:MAG: OmpA-OmpF porin, family [Betaproteobacteria bacterium]|jgi:opacity protein-like surface antigen|nr:OmpA-OmpF porin, family [Betaproteobacteria bacterium]